MIIRFGKNKKIDTSVIDFRTIYDSLKKRAYLFVYGKESSPMKIFNNRKMLFIHINKTGGTSINRIIGHWGTNHRTALQLKNIVGTKAFNESFKFAFVRNPWDKVASQYRFRVRTDQCSMKVDPISFHDWVVEAYKCRNSQYYNFPKMFMPQVEWLKDETGEIVVDFIGRFESIKEDFQKVCAELGTDWELPHLNKTRKKNYTEYYDDETKEIIEDWFIDDIKEFKYEF